LKEKARLQKALTAAENQLAELKDELNEVLNYSNYCSPQYFVLGERGFIQ